MLLIPTYMSASMVGLLAAGAVLCAYAVVWLQWKRARKMLAHLPAFINLPFFGSYFKFVGEEAIVRSVEELSEIADEKNLPFVVWAGTVPMIMFQNMEEVKTVTNAFIEKPYYYGFMRDWLGESIFVAPASVWKRNIKILAGTFSKSIVDGYQDVFNQQAEVLLHRLKGEVGKPPFDVLQKYLMNTTLQIIIQTALGVNEVDEKIVNKEYFNAFKNTMNLLHERCFFLPFHLDSIYRLSPSYRRMKKNITVMHKISDAIIDARQKQWEEKAVTTADDSHMESSGTKWKSFLDMLLDMQDKNELLTLQHIKSEVDSVAFGGQETVATTLAFVLMLIGQKTEIQDKVYAEIIEIFGESKRLVQTEDLAQMVYCEAVIYETLRLYPAVIISARYADRDLKLQSCTVPKGAHCALNIWGAGRSRRTWGPDALEFRPERWLNPEVSDRFASLLSFSFGRRACIGRKYAVALIKTALVHCLRELRFSSELDKMRFTIEMAVLRAVGGQLVTVQRR